MYGTKLQKWEQITTWLSPGFFVVSLWCMVQSYKNESKSQPSICIIITSDCCDVWYKVTKMRANHNRQARRAFGSRAVMYGTKLQKWEQITTEYPLKSLILKLWCMVQSYKNESKSQPEDDDNDILKAVMYGTKLQKWEQITTYNVFSRLLKCCDVWYKVTKMRANHN